MAVFLCGTDTMTVHVYLCYRYNGYIPLWYRYNGYIYVIGTMAVFLYGTDTMAVYLCYRYNGCIPLVWVLC